MNNVRMIQIEKEELETINGGIDKDKKNEYSREGILKVAMNVIDEVKNFLRGND